MVVVSLMFCFVALMLQSLLIVVWVLDSLVVGLLVVLGGFGFV